jgi:3',5'-cyclic AMP phosphodiesterase CpdA
MRSVDGPQAARVRLGAASRWRLLGARWMTNLAEIRRDGTPVDLVVFTGNLGDWGDPTDYPPALAFLKQTCAALDVPLDRLFVVPGNHDINRRVQGAAWASLRHEVASDPHAYSRWLAGEDRGALRGDNRRDQILERQQAFWAAMVTELGRPELAPWRSPHGRLGYRQAVMLPGLSQPIHVIGLDTAWLAGDEGDSGQLRLTEHQVSLLTTVETGEPLPGFRLALMHHRFADLADGADARRDLADRVDLLLHGHQDEPATDVLQGPDHQLVVLATGCLYEDDDSYHPPNACQVIDLTLDEHARPLGAEVRFRGWSERGMCWGDESLLYESARNGRFRLHRGARGWRFAEHGDVQQEHANAHAPGGSTISQFPCETADHHGGRTEERHPVSDEKASRVPPRFANEEPAVTILHLSDVQFGKHHRFADENEGFNTLLQRLCDDLDLLKRENGLVPDLVALTGDLAEWGTKREFAQVAELGEGLLRHLQLEPDRLLVVPGNHDINRKLCEAYFNRCEGEGEAPKPPYWPKWEPFVGLVNGLYRDRNVDRYRFTELEPWTLFEIPALKVVVAGLNSTIHESHLDADHHGFVGEAQLRWFRDKLADYERKGWLRVGLVHHNVVRKASVDDENLKDADLLREYLGELLHVLLHGHTHQGRVEMLGPLLPVISTGSAAVKRDQRPGPSPDQPGETPNQYQLVRLTRTGLWCAARAYTYEPKRWIGDTRVSRSGDRWWYSLDRAWPRAEATFPPLAAAPPGRDAAEPVVHLESSGVPADVLARQVAGAPPTEESVMTREELLSRLSKLLSSQFEQVLYLARIPTEHLPSPTAAQALRAVELMRYIEQQNQFEQLARIVHQVIAGGSGQADRDPR